MLLLVVAVAAYIGARQTSVFAVRTIEVRGGTPALRDEVRAALAGEQGESLLAVNASTVGRRVSALPGVLGFTFDRAFPHTLRVVVEREVPVLVVRRVPGSDAFLVAASGKVIRFLPNARRSGLPRIWVKRSTPLTVGAPLPGRLGDAATTVSLVRGARLPRRVRSVRVGDDELAIQLGGGFEIRLGDVGDLRLKLAIARRILAQTGPDLRRPGYIDVSVPERPVVADNAKVEG